MLEEDAKVPPERAGLSRRRRSRAITSAAMTGSEPASTVHDARPTMETRLMRRCSESTKVRLRGVTDSPSAAPLLRWRSGYDRPPIGAGPVPSLPAQPASGQGLASSPSRSAGPSPRSVSFRHAPCPPQSHHNCVAVHGVLWRLTAVEALQKPLRCCPPCPMAANRRIPDGPENHGVPGSNPGPATY
jgi:hypothetical protein